MYVQSTPGNQTTKEIQKHDLSLITNKKFSISDENGNYSYETYESMIAALPTRISMLNQAINVQQMNEELDFFKLLIKFPKAPDVITEKEFILSLLLKIQELQNDELLLKFSCYIVSVYEDDTLVPPKQLIQSATQIILSAMSPLQELQDKVISNFLIFLESTIHYMDKKLLKNREFYVHLSQFFNTSTEFNFSLTSFLVSIFDYVSTDILSYFPSFINLMYESIIPFEIQNINENKNENSMDIIMNVLSIIIKFGENCIDETNDFFLQNIESIVNPLSDLWGISEGVNSNLICIVSHVSKLAIKSFETSVQLQKKLFDIIARFLDNKGAQIVLDSLKSSTDYSTESFYLIKRLIHINFSKGTNFLYNGESELFQLFNRVLYFCVDGRISERTAAGCCFSTIIRMYPNLMLNENSEIAGLLNLSESEISDISEDPELLYYKIIFNLLDLEDIKLSKELIKALFVISKRYYDMDQLHDFREKCDYYNIEGKVNRITDKFDKDETEDLYDLGVSFVSTAFGVLHYSDADSNIFKYM